MTSHNVDEAIEHIKYRGATGIEKLKKLFGEGTVNELLKDNRIIIIRTENNTYLDLKEEWEGVFEAIEKQMKEKEKEKERVIKELQPSTIYDFKVSNK